MCLCDARFGRQKGDTWSLCWTRFQRESLVKPTRYSACHDLNGIAQPREPQGRVRGAITVRASAVSHKKRPWVIFGHFGGDDLAVGQVDRAGHMPFLEKRRATGVQQHKTWIAASEGLVRVPAICLEGEFRFEVPDGYF